VVLSEFVDIHGHIPTDGDATEDAKGIIGAGPAAQLMATIKLGQEMPSYGDIVKNPSKAKVPTKPDAQMLVCYSLAARVMEKDLDPIVEYIERLPKEFSVTFARAAVKRDSSLVETAAMGLWCTRNASLMSAIQDVR
jgi:hypothetical protein